MNSRLELVKFDSDFEQYSLELDCMTKGLFCIEPDKDNNVVFVNKSKLDSNGRGAVFKTNQIGVLILWLSTVPAPTEVNPEILLGILDYSETSGRESHILSDTDIEKLVRIAGVYVSRQSPEMYALESDSEMSEYLLPFVNILDDFIGFNELYVGLSSVHETLIRDGVKSFPQIDILAKSLGVVVGKDVGVPLSDISNYINTIK